MTKIIIRIGDITNFSESEAIVNPGNESLLGCFTPGHNCLDNQIHRKAGPQLHLACKTIMGLGTSRNVNVGDCIITKVFGYIPNRFIIHTCGT
jgi:O-acetyl-ADP-ribose deacetylase (regulator of RNase III)